MLGVLVVDSWSSSCESRRCEVWRRLCDRGLDPAPQCVSAPFLPTLASTLTNPNLPNPIPNLDWWVRGCNRKMETACVPLLVSQAAEATAFVLLALVLAATAAKGSLGPSGPEFSPEFSGASGEWEKVSLQISVVSSRART